MGGREKKRRRERERDRQTGRRGGVHLICRSFKEEVQKETW